MVEDNWRGDERIHAWMSTLTHMVITLSVISNVVKLDFVYSVENVEI